MRAPSSLFVGFVIGVVAACSPPADTEACSADTCDGCCTEAGDCLSGAAVDACGAGGAACLACPANEVCRAGACGRYENGAYDASFPERPDAGINPDAGVYQPDGGTVVEPTDDGGVQMVSYLSQIKPIIDAKCVTCHAFTHANLISSGNVMPGSPDSSEFFTRVASDNMPRGGSPLTNTQKRLIRDWILNGAPNN